MNEPGEIQLEDLPPVAREIAEIVGVTGCLRLARHFGGVRMTIPRPENLGETHHLALLLGYDAAQRLAFRMGGAERVKMPSLSWVARRAMLNERNAAIVADIEGGASWRDLVQRYALTRDQLIRVHRAAQKGPAADAVAPQQQTLRV